MTATHCLNADLHCHSVQSDGTLRPEELAQRAHKNGVQLWALTDHDELSGIEQARASAKECGLAFLSGVEISVTFANKTVHILGLGFDENNAQLISGLANARGGRLARAQQMADGLAKIGIKNVLQGALQYADNPELISRSHFARHLVATGVCPDIPSVFRKYLTEGKPGFIPHRWVTLKDAVTWIVQAGGEAVVAHPGRYGFTSNEEYAFFTDFVGYGGRAVEVVTSCHTEAEYAVYTEVALEFGLAASRGSDFHSPAESRVELGALPPLSPSLPTVWELLVDRIE